MADAAALEEILAALPRPSPAEALAEVEKAGRDVYLVEPTIIPMPEFPGSFSGVARYPCGLGCGWAHEEHEMAWQLGPIVFRPDEPDSLAKALTENADRLAAEMRNRIENAIRGHFAQDHPGLAIPLRGDR